MSPTTRLIGWLGVRLLVIGQILHVVGDQSIAVDEPDSIDRLLLT